MSSAETSNLKPEETQWNNTHMLSDKRGIPVVGANIIIWNSTFLWFDVQYLQQVDFLVIQCY